MTETLLINIAIIILLLPLLGFTVSINLGAKLKKIYYFEIFIISITLFLSVIASFFKLSDFINEEITSSFTWIAFNNIKIDLGIKIDNLTVIMLFVVNLISFLVHLFSLEYMKGDKKFNRYYSYLGIFTFSMLGIVLTDNLLMMYIFWELVGLSSYLLIGFWFEKKSAADAGKKAFLTNRVGDIGLFLGILILFSNYGTFNFNVIYSNIKLGILPFDSSTWLTVTGILLFMGAVGKSAQFPLHIWLPDAMEGPTPVSALIHAATMVAAGVYLSLRLFAMLTADAMLVIAVIGAFTSFFAATIAITQTDIKRILAYSTVSQLGYMIMSIGIGAYAFAFFHLVTHAFFKACLFLGAGSVIHSMHHSQELEDLGGLRKKMPITYLTFLISTLAISGIPLTSGFLSKDGILAGTLVFGKLTGHWVIPIFGFTVALLTAFYMFRLVILTFHGEPRNKEKLEHAHESPWLMTLPLVVLTILSLFIIYTTNPISADSGWFINKWISTPETVVPEEMKFEFMKSPNTDNSVYSKLYEETVHQVHYPAMILSVTLGIIGILFAFLFYHWKKINVDKLTNSIKPLYKLSKNKWYVDELYNATFINGTLILSKIITWFDNNIIDGIVNASAKIIQIYSSYINWIDKYIVDGLVNLSAVLSGTIGILLRKVQTGKVQTYIVYVILSIIILLIVFKPV